MNWFLLAFISAVFSAVSTISEKKALFSLKALDFSFLVSVVTLVFSVPFFFNIQYNALFTISMAVLFLKTLLNAGAYLSVMQAIKNMEVSEALPLIALSPGLVAILGASMIGDSLHFHEWAGILLMITGTYILELRKNNSGILQPFKLMLGSQKYLYVFIALILFTITSLLDRLLLKNYSLPPYTFMAFQQLFFVIIFFAAFAIGNKGNIAVINNLSRKVLYTVIIVSVCTVIYRYTQIEATKIAPAALVLAVKRISVLLVVVFGGKLFAEGNIFRKSLAAFIILSGITILLLK
jgi:uncharacterized membrane protein